MRCLSVSDVETDNGEYSVELFDISVYVSVYKRRRDGLIYQQKLSYGSQRFRAAIKALIRRSEPGSLTREHLAQCDCGLVQKLLAEG